MKLKIFILILILVLCTVSVSAEWKKIHEGWHEYNDDFVIDGTVYQITLNEQVNDDGEHDRLFMSAEEIRTIVELGDCEIKELFKFCYDNYTFDRNEAQIKSNGIAMPAVKVLIYKDEEKSYDIKFSHDFKIEEKTLKEIPITLLVENEGDDWIRDIDYALDLPKDIKVVNQYNYVWDGSRRLKLSFSLSPKESREFLLTVLPQSFDVHIINYSYDYITPVDGEKEKSGKYNLDVSAPFKITTSLSESNPGIGDKIYFDVNVQNKNVQNKVIIKKLSIKGPKDFDYVPIKNLKFERVGEHKSSKNAILQDTAQEFRLAMTTMSEGKKNITFNYEFEIEGELFEQEIVKTFTVEEKSMQVSLDLTKSDVLPGENIRLDLIIKNTDSEVAFRDIIFELESELFGEKINVPVMDPLTEKRITIAEFDVPLIENDKEYEFKGYLAYKGESSREFHKETSKNLKVTGSGEIVKLTQSVNTTNVKPGSVILVTLNVENLKDQTFQNINFFEQYPRQIELITGDTHKNIDLENKEKEQVYIYKLQVPLKYTSEKFNVTSTMVMPRLGYTKSLTKTINVEIPEDIFDEVPKEEVKTEPAKPKVVAKKEPEPEKGFFAKVIDSIEGFFTGLFGG